MKVLSSCAGTCIGGARHLTSTLGARAGAVSCGVSALELFDELLVGCDACDAELLDLLCFFVCCFAGGVRDVCLCVLLLVRCLTLSSCKASGLALRLEGV